MDNSFDEFENFIREQDSGNTNKVNLYAINTLNRFLKNINETRNVEHIPEYDLNILLSRFFRDITKKDGSNFEPDCLSTIHRGLKRFLDTKAYPVNILCHESFEGSRKVLAAKRKQLTKLGLGNKPNATRELSEHELNILFTDGYFSMSSGETLQRGMWWFISIHFGYRARDEARKLCWGDIALVYDDSEKKEYLTWNAERGTKTRQGLECHGSRAYNPEVYETKNDRCPVAYYKTFTSHRPADACLPHSPFFLAINWKATDNIWYLNRPLGKNKIGDILSNARKKYHFEGKKVANHSVRKTGIGRLLDANVPETFVAQHSGMKSIDSLKSYKSANKKQRMSMSDILNNDDRRKTSCDAENVSDKSPVLNLSQQSSSKQTVFSNATFEGCTFNFGV